MKQFSASLLNLFIVSSFLCLISISTFAQTQSLTINNNTTISATDPPREVGSIIYNNSSKLTITGTLIVNGDFNMDKNDASLELKEGGRLIVYGNFIAANKVNITLGRNSYFFVYGNFSKGGSSNQDVVIIDNAKIYILGNSEKWGGNLESCNGTYQGTTTNENDSCDFGTGKDYENHQDEFPDDLVEQLNCYDLSSISNREVCEGSKAIFNVSLIPDVNYQWQRKKIGEADWIKVGSNSNIYVTPITAIEDNGNLYRVIVRPKTPADSSCKLSISRKVSLSVKQTGIWIGTQDTNWNNTANWSCNTLPTLETNVLIPENLASGNYPVVKIGSSALAKNLTIENTASLVIDDNWLRIAGTLLNKGIFNTKLGSVSFEGTAAQIIPNAAFENNTIRNLSTNNTSGITSKAIIEVTGVLKIEAGSFDTGNDLTLISNEEQTALIDGGGSGEVIGLVSMQRYLDKAFGYKYFSSPFQSSVVGDFFPYMNFEDPISGFPNFYRYDENRNVLLDGKEEDATGWVVYTNPSNNLNIAEGYALNFGNTLDAETIEIIGEVNNGIIPSRQLLNNHRKYTRGFHLVGNPYPSPIDWDAAQGWNRNNIDDGIYFFTASDTSQYTGTYTAYVNDISTEDRRSSNIIPSMQGFFIKVSDSETENLVTGSFGMDNRVRVTNFDQEFLKFQTSDQKSIIRLEAGFNNANRKDPMVIYFSPYATQNFEKELDAHKLMNTDPTVPSFYNITENKKELAINAITFPESKSYKKIRLGIKADHSGMMNISLTSIENISSNFNVYIIDHEKTIGQNLRDISEYSFNIEAGTHDSRFELLFSEEEITSSAIAFNMPFDIKVEEGNVVIILNLENNQEGILRASTITGQILQTKKGSGKDRVIFDGITSNGVYIINLQVGKEQHAKKILIKK